MRPELAKFVFPVLNYGLRLRERLREGEEPNLQEQQVLLKNLLNDREAMGIEAYCGTRADDFGGCRYLLAGWLDELMIDGTSDWGRRWADNSLEWQLFRSNDRAWKFCKTAGQAETQPTWGEAAEVAFLCLLLGFQGDPEDPMIPPELQWQGETREAKRHSWVKERQRPLAKALGQATPVREGDTPPEPDVEPLLGFGKYQRMVGVRLLLFAAALLAFAVGAVMML